LALIACTSVVVLLLCACSGHESRDGTTDAGTSVPELLVIPPGVAIRVCRQPVAVLARKVAPISLTGLVQPVGPTVGNTIRLVLDGRYAPEYIWLGVVEGLSLTSKASTVSASHVS
jgi:hypothetical protein